MFEFREGLVAEQIWLDLKRGLKYCIIFLDFLYTSENKILLKSYAFSLFFSLEEAKFFLFMGHLYLNQIVFPFLLV